MLLFMNWTADGGIAPLVKMFYYQQQIKTFSQELKIVICTAYYFSVLCIGCYGAGWLYYLASRKEEDDNSPVPQFTQTTNDALAVGFHTFVIFEAFFYYLLNNDGGTCSFTQMTSAASISTCCPSGSWPAG